jgi:hypothetical protein
MKQPDGNLSRVQRNDDAMNDNQMTFQAYFEPDTVRILSAAYERALDRLGEMPVGSSAPAHVLRREIARQIITAAKTGERDLERLCELALSAWRRESKEGARERNPAHGPASDPAQ